MEKPLSASETVALQVKIPTKTLTMRFFSSLIKKLSVHFNHVVPRAFSQLALLGLLLLLLSTALAATLAMQQLRSIAHVEAQARAQQVADSVAGRITRALTLGVPLAELVGVPALFDQRMQQVPGIVALAMVDGSNQPLWLQLPQQPVAQRGLQAQGKDALALPLVPSGLSVSAPVYAGNADALAAQVVLVWQDADAGSLWVKSLLPLVAWSLAIGVLAARALSRSLRRGRLRRSDVLQQAIDRVLVGDFSQPLPLLHPHEFDTRPAWLAAQLRLVNEQHLRISRLHHSLRQTEPDAARRGDLDAALAFANTTQRFRDPQNLASVAPLHFDQEVRSPQPAQNPVEINNAKPSLQWLMRGSAALCLFAGIVLPLLLAFAPEWLAATTGPVVAALLFSALGNCVWLAGMFIRSVAAPSTRGEHHVA